MRIASGARAPGGFTLLELVGVIVIIGILAAISIPRFKDLAYSTSRPTMDGVASAVASATYMNYLAAQSGSSNTVLINFPQVCSRGDIVQKVMQGGAFPRGYGIITDTANDPQDCSGGALKVTCRIQTGPPWEARDIPIYCNR